MTEIIGSTGSAIAQSYNGLPSKVKATIALGLTGAIITSGIILSVRIKKLNYSKTAVSAGF